VTATDVVATHAASVVRRAVDVVVAAVLLVLATPVVALLMLAVRLASPGPSLFRQVREGRGGRPFVMLKLRTMHVDSARILAEHVGGNPAARIEWERFFRLTNDPRLIPGLGPFLRRTSLDELPQLWNILLGDMSLVGPRPLQAEPLAALRPEFRALRSSVRPGLTGLWQISGRSETDIRGLEELDAEYVRTRSLAGDLRILARTPAAVLSGRGSY
jgi:lipopolysaccharide/colanic/teichoic acid biosynthesis glycosyltransferase